MAREAAPDPNNGLADAEPGFVEAGEHLELYDQKIVDLDAETKIAWAHALESAARGVDPRVKKFRDSGVSTSDSISILVTSKGAQRQVKATNIGIWCVAIGEDASGLQTEYWWDTKSHLEDLEDVEAVGRKAAIRAARMLGAKQVKSQTVPVVLEPSMAAGFVGGVLAAIDGDMVYKKASFLSDKLGEQIASDRLTFVDDPLLKRGVSSMPFDGEGLAAKKKNLIDRGKLTTFLYDSYTARKAGVAPTANGQRSVGSTPHAGPFNVYVEAGTDDAAEIVASMDKGFILTRGLGRGVNAVSGEYSRGANGLWVENGEVVHPVQEVTIAGDFLKLLHSIDRVGHDLDIRGSSGAPTLRVAEMTLSGS